MNDLTAAVQRYADAEHARQPVCSRCGAAGEPYEHRGVRFDGLTAVRGERLCGPCTGACLKSTPVLVEERIRPDVPGPVYDINPDTATEETGPPVRAVAAAYRYRDWRPPGRRRRA
jgi:hypothetical protein